MDFGDKDHPTKIKYQDEYFLVVLRHSHNHFAIDQTADISLD